jgi:lipopolysaccharide assembly protein A
MRVLRLLLAILSIAAGVTLGALNPDPVSIDLGLVVLHSTLGIVLLSSLLAGALAAGIVLVLTVVVPLQHRLRGASRRAQPTQRSGS